VNTRRVTLLACGVSLWLGGLGYWGRSSLLTRILAPTFLVLALVVVVLAFRPTGKHVES
jgi:hypothetical protein